jgi:hypothetical protein
MNTGQQIIRQLKGFDFLASIPDTAVLESCFDHFQPFRPLRVPGLIMGLVTVGEIQADFFHIVI